MTKLEEFLKAEVKIKGIKKLKIILALLMSASENNEITGVSKEKIARISNCSQGYVITILNDLETKGYIIKTKSKLINKYNISGLLGMQNNEGDNYAK